MSDNPIAPAIRVLRQRALDRPTPRERPESAGCRAVPARDAWRAGARPNRMEESRLNPSAKASASGLTLTWPAKGRPAAAGTSASIGRMLRAANTMPRMAASPERTMFFRQKLPHELAARGADGGGHGKLISSRRVACQQQICHVGASDQHHNAHGGLEQEERPA